MADWRLFWGFLQVGCFAFGGAYGAIPLIRDVVLSNGWLDDGALSYMIAVSESTPGPIMVNLATYVGSRQGGVAGALLATLAVVLPSFCVILLVTAALKKLLRHPVVQALLQGLKPCMVGIVLGTGVWMVASRCLAPGGGLQLPAAGLTAVLAAVQFWGRGKKGRGVSSISIILLGAVLGAVVYGL